MEFVLDNELYTPTYETSSSVGFDIRSSVAIPLPAGRFVLVDTGLYIKPGSPKVFPVVNEETGKTFYLKEHLEIRPRSGLALKYGITVLNAPGTIDPDYQGEIKVLLINLGSIDFSISIGERIAQGVITLAGKGENLKLKEKKRGTGGFGSTGEK